MRIAFFLNTFPKLSETFILNQITGILDLGHDVTIFGAPPRHPEPLHPQVEAYDLLRRTLHLTPPPRKFLKRLLTCFAGFIAKPEKRPALRRAVSFRHWGGITKLCCTCLTFPSQQEFDVIHCHFGPSGDMAARLRDVGLLNGPIVTTFHGYDVNVLPGRKGADMYRYLFSAGDLFTASSSFIRNKLLRLGAPESKTVRHKVGIDTAVYPEREAGGRLRTLLTVGRLVEVKGIEYGIRAVAELSKTIDDLCYLVVGEGPLRSSLEKLADDLNVSQNVIFLGGKTQEELLSIYAKSDIFILPGIVASDGAEEGQGMVLLEAQAAGVPVVASRVGGIPESIQDGRSGILVPAGNVSELARNIALLLGDAELQRTMGTQGRRYVRENFDIHSLNLELQNTYSNIKKGFWG